MTRFAAHENPAIRPVPAVMVQVRLDNLPAEAERSFEQIWTRRLKDNKFEVACIPFFTYNITLGDIIKVEQAYGFDYSFRSVETNSDNGSIRLAVVDPTDVDAVHESLHRGLTRLSYLHEWFAPGYVAINLDLQKSHEELIEIIATVRDKVQIDRVRIPFTI